MSEHDMLVRLLRTHLWLNSEGGFEWAWVPGVGLHEHDLELNEALKTVKISL
jgi:hypothetical protein